MSSTPCWSRGALPAPCLVSRRCSVSHGSAPLRLVDVMFFWGSCLRAPQFPRPLPLHFRGIEARFISQSLTLLLVGRAGWLLINGCICRGGRIICQLRQLGPPLCGPPHRQPSPRTPRMGLVKGKTPFEVFFDISYYFDILYVSSSYAKLGCR